MRDYAKAHTRWWKSETFKTLRDAGELEIAAIAEYLMWGPHSNMWGLYHLPLVYMAGDLYPRNEIATAIERCSNALRRLSELRLIDVDEASEVVFVRECLRFEAGETVSWDASKATADDPLKGASNNLKGWASSLPELTVLCQKSPCFQAFLDRYTGWQQLFDVIGTPFERRSNGVRRVSPPESSKQQAESSNQEAGSRHSQPAPASRAEPEGSSKDFLDALIAAAWPGERFAVDEADEALAAEWERAGYPLDLLVRTIERMVDRNDRKKLPQAETLRYFDQEIQKQGPAWLAKADRAPKQPAPWPAPGPEPEEGREIWDRLLEAARELIAGELDVEEAQTFCAPLRFQGLNGRGLYAWAPEAITHNHQHHGWLQEASKRAGLGLEVRWITNEEETR